MKQSAVAAATSSAKRRLYTRQRHLLALLQELGGSVGNTDFQKLLFLHCQEDFRCNDLTSAPLPYEFVPYKYGAFSFTSYADRRRLAGLGLLTQDESVWQITETGRQVASGARSSEIANFATRHSGSRGDALIAETYRAYPYYAIHSERAESLLQDDPDATQAIKACAPKRARGALFTIGYEGRSLESYLNSLIRAGVSLLCDVRKNPISRKYGFSRGTLQSACTRLGLRYCHHPELGVSSDRRKALRSKSDYAQLFRYYRESVLSKHKRSLREIVKWLREGEAVALTCYEEDASMCHRSSAAAEVLTLQRSSQNFLPFGDMATYREHEPAKLIHLP